MKHLLILNTLIFIPCILSTSIQKNYFPNLPFGEYTVYFRAFIKCNPTDKNIFEFNVYMSKISSNVSEVRGNVSLLQQLDDSYSLHVNLAVKDTTRGWKDNAYDYRAAKFCTTIKNFMGSATLLLSDGFNTTFACPLPRGFYISKGIDSTQFISKLNVPKQFFYGSYKTILEILDKQNKIVGCFVIIMDVKRPWETE